MNRENRYDLCIVGAGASGMVAAIRAKQDRPGLRVLLVDKNAQPGKKLRATGNGRCNLSHAAAADSARVLDFLGALGLAVRVLPSGLIYPYSESAQDVAELFAARMCELGCDLLTNTRVTVIEKNDRFAVYGERQSDSERKENKTLLCTAERVLIAAGGKAGPDFGTTGDGAKLASALGHTIVRQVPVLAPIECAKDDPAQLAGVRARGTVRLYKKGREIFAEDGEIQFTKFGLSGICVFNMTRLMRFGAGETMEDFEVGIDLFAGGSISAFLARGRDAAEQNASPEAAPALLRTVVKDRLARYVVQRAGLDEKCAAALSEDDLAALASCVHDLRFRPTAIRGWKEAQCTSGGVARSEIDGETGESTRVPGLFFSGEVTDYDGPCGGYNLNYAWLTGIATGAAIAAAAPKDERDE